MEFIGTIEARLTDPVEFKNAIDDLVDIGKWLENLPVAELEKLKTIMTKYDKSGHSDYVIKSFAKQYPPLIDMEVTYQGLINK